VVAADLQAAEPWEVLFSHGGIPMKLFLIATCVVLLALALVFGCQSKKEASEQPATEPAPGAQTADTAMTSTEPAAEPAEGTAKTAEGVEPDYITVQHILIGFEGSVPGKNITRTMEEAEGLARELFGRAKSGEDFDELVKVYTDDAFPGIYKMANLGVPADRSKGIYPRDGMVKAFGDVGFPLEVGEVGLAVYDSQASKYGWHVIKRIE